MKAHDEGDVQKVARLIQLEDGVSVCQDHCGRTILHRSVLNGDVHNVQRIIELDSKLLNVQDNV